MLRIISEGNLKLSNCEKCGAILIYDEKEIKQEKKYWAKLCFLRKLQKQNYSTHSSIVRRY